MKLYPNNEEIETFENEEIETPEIENEETEENEEIEEIEETEESVEDQSSRLDMETKIKKLEAWKKKSDAIAKFSNFADTDDMLKTLEEQAITHKVNTEKINRDVAQASLEQIKNMSNNEEMMTQFFRENLEIRLKNEFGVPSQKAKNYIKEAELNLKTSINNISPTVIINQIKGTRNLVHVDIQKKVNKAMIKKNKTKTTKLKTATTSTNTNKGNKGLLDDINTPVKGQLPSSKGIIDTQKILIASANSLFSHYIEEGYAPDQALKLLSGIPKFTNLIKNNLIGDI